MKLHVLSDLHLEAWDYAPDPVAVKAADVIVLAGDIQPGTAGLIWARKTYGDKPIVYVAGNHEFFEPEQEWDRTLDELRQVARVQDVHFLENDSVEIAGVRMLGCTLWTDFAFFDPERHRVDALRTEAEKRFADYRVIKAARSSSGLLTTELSMARHKDSVEWLRQELAGGNPANTVVVTHHYPDKGSCKTRYVTEPMTAAYGSQLDPALILQAGLWIHGHVHDKVHYRIAGNGRNTSVVANPRGYGPTQRWPDYENLHFEPKYLVEQLADGNWGEVTQ